MKELSYIQGCLYVAWVHVNKDHHALVVRCHAITCILPLSFSLRHLTIAVYLSWRYLTAGLAHGRCRRLCKCRIHLLINFVQFLFTCFHCCLGDLRFYYLFARWWNFFTSFCLSKGYAGLLKIILLCFTSEVLFWVIDISFLYFFCFSLSLDFVEYIGHLFHTFPYSLLRLRRATLYSYFPYLPVGLPYLTFIISIIFYWFLTC